MDLDMLARCFASNAVGSFSSTDFKEPANSAKIFFKCSAFTWKVFKTVLGTIKFVNYGAADDSLSVIRLENLHGNTAALR
eukprot:g37336.t1